MKEIQIQETLLSRNKFCDIKIIYQRIQLYRLLILGFLEEENRTLHLETPFVRASVLSSVIGYQTPNSSFHEMQYRHPLQEISV